MSKKYNVITVTKNAIKKFNEHFATLENQISNEIERIELYSDKSNTLVSFIMYKQNDKLVHAKDNLNYTKNYLMNRLFYLCDDLLYKDQVGKYPINFPSKLTRRAFPSLHKGIK